METNIIIEKTWKIILAIVKAFFSSIVSMAWAFTVFAGMGALLLYYAKTNPSIALDKLPTGLSLLMTIIYDYWKYFWIAFFIFDGYTNYKELNK